MFLCLELFHPGKVTSFSHRLIAVPLNLALVPQSALCSDVECLPVGLGDWFAVLLIWNALPSPWFFLWLWNPSPSRPGLMACCVVPANLTSTSPVCVAVCHYSSIVHQSSVLPAYLRLDGFLRGRDCAQSSCLWAINYGLHSEWWMTSNNTYIAVAMLTTLVWARVGLRSILPLPRRVQPRCSPDRIC